MDKKVYTVTEVAQMLGLSRPKVYKMIQDGELVKLKVSSRVLISKHHFDEFLRSS